jgi:hypothetical protein
MPLNINNLTAGTPVTFNAQTSAQRMVFDSATVAFRIVNNTTGIVTVSEENSDGFICQVNPGATELGLMQNAILVEAQYSGPVTITPFTWIPVSSGASNTFTSSQTFNAPSSLAPAAYFTGGGPVSTVMPTIFNFNNVAHFVGGEAGVSSVGTGSSAYTTWYSATGSNVFFSAVSSGGSYASRNPVTTNAGFQLINSTWNGVQYRQTGGFNWRCTEVTATTSACGCDLNLFVTETGTNTTRASWFRNNGTFEPFAGIRFGSAGLSVLSTYEEGTWTPVVSSTGATFSVNATQTVGRYVRIGKLVTVEFAVSLSGATTGTTTNQVNFAGMPYASQLIGTGHNHRPVLIGENFTTTATGGLVANLIASTAFNVAVASTTGGTAALTAATFSGSGARITGAFTYQVA